MQLRGITSEAIGHIEVISQEMYAALTVKVTDLRVATGLPNNLDADTRDFLAEMNTVI
jgi:hypothetical protein